MGMEKDNDAEKFYAREKTIEKKRKKKKKPNLRMVKSVVKLTGVQKIYKFLLFIFLIWSFLLITDLAYDPIYEYFKWRWEAKYVANLRAKGDWKTLAKHQEIYELRHEFDYLEEDFYFEDDYYYY